jgi:tRNA threonylcarbamoyl adenosine modification protein YeaZ
MAESISGIDSGHGEVGKNRERRCDEEIDSAAVKILALELSSTRGSIAFGEDEYVEENWPNERRNSGTFFEKLSLIRKKHGPADVVIVGLGPGSYAGIRIAVATAIGLAAAWQARLLGAPSICAMAGDCADFFAIGDARRNSFFIAEVKDRALLCAPQLLPEGELRERIASNEALPVFSAEALPQFKGVEQRFPSAIELAKLAATENRSITSAPLEPLYLREPSVTFPKSAPVGRK